MRSKRRRLGRLGDLLDNKILSIQSRAARTGSPLPQAKAEKQAKRELCREGHKSYCGSDPEFAARMREAKARKRDIAAEQGGADVWASLTYGKPVTEAKIEKSEAKAESAGCTIKTPGRTCVGADVARFSDKKGKVHTRKGCKPIPRRPGFFSCSDTMLKRLAAGKKAAASRLARKGKTPVGYKVVGKKTAIKKHCVEVSCGKFACKKGR